MLGSGSAVEATYGDEGHCIGEENRQTAQEADKDRQTPPAHHEQYSWREDKWHMNSNAASV